MPFPKRIAITGMSAITPLGDTLDGFLSALLAGRSAVRRLTYCDTENIYVKIGGDLSGYDQADAAARLAAAIPPATADRLRLLLRRFPWSTRFSLLVAADAWRDAGLFETPPEPTRVATLTAGHNINTNIALTNAVQFLDEPDFIDGLYSIQSLDTSHCSIVSELLNAHGPMYTTGGACASGNYALRAAISDICCGDADVAVVVGGVTEFSPLDLHALALMNAVSYRSFNDEPERASRPFDVRREGFVSAHGAGALIVEPLERAVSRGARIYAEVLAVETGSDASHMPQPSEESQVRIMASALRKAGIAAEQVGYVNAHATSTPLGDLVEVKAITRLFGPHLRSVRVNATKSMLGHLGWSSAVVEGIAGILQMRAGQLHPTINVDEQDPEIDIDVCRDGPVPHTFDYFLNNSFGFGGFNAVSLFGRYGRQ